MADIEPITEVIARAMFNGHQRRENRPASELGWDCMGWKWTACANDGLAALEAAGYVIVPREPTEAMADKGESSLICGPEPRDLEDAPGMKWAHAKSCWRAMIEAAPK